MGLASRAFFDPPFQIQIAIILRFLAKSSQESPPTPHKSQKVIKIESLHALLGLGYWKYFRASGGILHQSSQIYIIITLIMVLSSYLTIFSSWSMKTKGFRLKFHYFSYFLNNFQMIVKIMNIFEKFPKF